MKYTIKSLLLALVVVTSLPSFGQCLDDGTNNITGSDCVNSVFTSIPFLRINPDGRAGGMGDVGIAISPDASSIYHNNSKLAFAEDKSGLAITYTPWLKALVGDMFIGHVAGYNRLDDIQAISGSFRFFNMGSIQFTDESGINLQEFNPHELAIDLGYARRLSDNLSAGLTLKYIYSNLAKGQSTATSGDINAANAVAADLSVFYTTDLDQNGRDANLSIGGAITNIGNKVSYTEDDIKDFIPINLGVGAAYSLSIDDYNEIMVAFDINKLLVPTPDTLFAGGDPAYPDHREKSLFSGMFGSFSDAPGGASEEFKELTYSLGAEYWYNKQFSVRAGYFHENRLKGNRQYITVGLGVKYSMLGLNFSYLVPTSSGTTANPLENTLRFSLLFDLDSSNND